MNIIYFIIIVTLALAALWYWHKLRETRRELARTQKELTQERQLFSGGFEEYNKKMQEIKEQRKQRVISELAIRTLQTNDVAELLDVSRTASFRYLEELEKEGVIEQIGKTGTKVSYQIKK